MVGWMGGWPELAGEGEAWVGERGLLGNEVEKGAAVPQRQQRLGILEAHAGAETSVQFEHHGTLEQRCVQLHLMDTRMQFTQYSLSY